ncbi:hypothetical protein J6590_002333 [Homalodisca vitripennis]|nr:hypothetical protein J6590_002333 [Homalodisca vitripennis]
MLGNSLLERNYSDSVHVSGARGGWVQNHKGESFTCECGKSYSHQASLYNHKTYHCGKAPQFSCRFCPMRTCRKGNLKTHMVLRHKDELASLIGPGSLGRTVDELTQKY